MFALAILTYNRPRLLKVCLGSVAMSLDKDFKLYVFDNGSSEESSNVVAEFSRSWPNLDFVRHESNIGMGRNADFALRYVREKFCMILHDDDVIAPWLTAAVNLAIAMAPDAAVIAADWCPIGDEDDLGALPALLAPTSIAVLDSAAYFKRHLEGLSFQWSGATVNTSLVVENSLYFDFDRNPICADAIFMAKLAMLGSLCHLAGQGVGYRIYDSQTTNRLGLQVQVSEWLENFRFYDSIIKKYFGDEQRRSHRQSTTRTILNLSRRYRFHPSLVPLFRSEFFAWSSTPCVERLKIWFGWLLRGVLLHPSDRRSK